MNHSGKYFCNCPPHGMQSTAYSGKEQENMITHRPSINRGFAVSLSRTRQNQTSCLRLSSLLPIAFYLLVFAVDGFGVRPAAAQEIGPIVTELKVDPDKLVRPSGPNVALAHLSFNYQATGARIDTLIVTSTDARGSTQTSESRAVQSYGILGSKGTGHYQAAFRANALPGIYKYQIQLIDVKNRKSVPASIAVEILENGPPAMQITAVEPASGGIGEKIVLRGTGFSTKGTAAAVGRVAAKVVEATENSLVFLVPSGAVTAPITVSNAKGVAVSPMPFTVANAMRVTGGQRTMLAGEKVRFAALIDENADRSAAWSVNGQIGGSSRYGTIDKFGNYVAPAVPPVGESIEITATSGATKLSSKTNIVIAPPHPVHNNEIIAVDTGGFVRDTRGLLTLEIPPSALARDTILTELSAQSLPSRNDLKGLPVHAFPLVRFQSKADKPSALHGPVRFRLLLPTRVPVGSKHPIMVRPNNATAFRDAGTAVAEKDGITASGTLNVADLDFTAIILQNPSLSLPGIIPTLEADGLDTPPDTQIEEGITLPVRVRGRGFAPGFTFVSAGGASTSCSTSGLDPSAFPLDQLLDFGPVLVSPDGTQLGFTVRIHPMYSLQLNQQLCFSFRIDIADGSGTIQSSVTTPANWFVVNGLPELIVCQQEDASRNCPAPEANLFTVEGLQVHKAIGDDQNGYRFSELRVESGAVLGVGAPITSIVADGTTYDLSTIGAFLDQYGHLNHEDGTSWTPDGSARIFQPLNHLVAIDVTGPVEISGTIYVRGMHGGQNASSQDLSWRGRLGGFASGTFSGGLGGDGGVSQGSTTVDGQAAGDSTDKGKGRGAGGVLEASQGLAGGGSRFDSMVFSFDDWWSTLAWFASFDVSETVPLDDPWHRYSTHAVLVKDESVLTRGNVAGTIGQAPVFAKLMSPQSMPGLQPVFLQG